MKTSYSVILIFSFLILQSCATLFFGPTQKVSVNTSPPGAEIYVNGKNTNKVTPAKVRVKKRVKQETVNAKNELVYTLKKEGYYDSEYRDNSDVRSLLLYYDFALFIVPGLIDLGTGSHLKYQNHIYMSMNKKETVVQEKIVYVPTEGGTPTYKFMKKSAVDKNIPTTPNQYNNRYALIIGNEDYSSHQHDLSNEVNVDFARNDASAFKEYAINVLGIPSENMIFLLDATSGQMNQSIAKANLIIKNTRGNADVFVYYAGHGLPDEVTKEAYLMPVDVSGKNASDGIALKTLYEKLTEHPSKRITVFIDACFSGGARNQGLIAARGVKINPKENPMGGNLVVFAASSGEQSSLPYKQEEHGFFTYYLLKKLQESGGQVTYNELSEYLIDNVSLKSVLINDKEQNPKVSVSSGSQDVWKNWELNE